MRSTRQLFLKIPKCLNNSSMLEELVFYFFYEIYRELRALVPRAACIISQQCTHVT